MTLRPIWKNIYDGSPHQDDNDQELVSVTRETLRLASSAMRKMNEEDYYNNNGAAEQEINSALASPEKKVPDIISDRDIRAGRPNHQAYDEVRIFTQPRWKESYFSGDEWRISGRIEFYLKGQLLGGRTYSNVASALQYGDWAAIELFENGQVETVDEFSYCDQEGCKEKAKYKFRLKKRYRNDGSEKEMLWKEHRCFCEQHRYRGDCGLDDADKNYEQIGEV